MAICPNCKHRYREPEDEQGDHGCPRCGVWPEEYCHEQNTVEDDSRYIDVEDDDGQVT